jgi:hypothetical protein
MGIYKRRHIDHVFNGSFFGEPLAKFLNRSEGTEAHRRIFILLILLRELDSVNALRRLPSDRDTLKKIDQLNKHLSRYKASPALLPHYGGFKEVPSGTSQAERSECFAVRNLIQLAISGLLGSLKRCEYKHGQWFFAKFAHQRFCNEKCRVRWNAETPEAKAYRAKKAREYYRREKELEEKARKGVRR